MGSFRCVRCGLCRYAYLIYDLQCTCSIILLLTEGGTPLAAMHRYAPISERVTLVRFTTSPSSDVTVNRNIEKLIKVCVKVKDSFLIKYHQISCSTTILFLIYFNIIALRIPRLKINICTLPYVVLTLHFTEKSWKTLGIAKVDKV